MDHAHKVNVPLADELDVSKATQFLLHELACDTWYVACHHEHLFVYRLAKGRVTAMRSVFNARRQWKKRFTTAARRGRCRSSLCTAWRSAGSQGEGNQNGSGRM